MKNKEFFPVKAVTKSEAKKYSNRIILPDKYVSPFIKVKDMLKKVGKKK